MILLGFCATCVTPAAFAAAQRTDPVSASQVIEEEPLPPPPPPQGQTAEAGAGRVGIRQRREQAQGIQPLARIDTRIANRVQSRLRNRIDRYYDPRANAISPFRVAEETQANPRR